MRQIKENILKISALFLAFLVVLNFILLVTRQIKAGLFWIITAISALIAYKVIPMLNKKH